MKKVSVIIVNYNGAHLLEGCLNSVYTQKYPRRLLEVIVVDNGSQDESLNILETKFPEVKIIKNKCNNYCQANNLGIENSRGEYIFLLNNDVILDSNYIGEIISVVDEDETAVLATGKILFSDGRIQSTGHVQLPNFYWADRGFQEADEGQYEQLQEVESVPNTAAIYKRKIFEKTGLFDEDFVMFMEDVDICYRIRKAGFKIMYIPQAKCIHKYHGSADEERVKFYIERNRLLFLAKHFPQRLPDNISGGGYATLGNSRPDLGRLMTVIPDAILKIYKTHGEIVCNDVGEKIKTKVKEVINFARYEWVQKINQELSALRVEKENMLRELEEKNRSWKEINREQEKLNKELEKLRKEFQTQMEEHQHLITEKKKLAEQKTFLEKQLADIYKEKELLNRSILHKDSEIKELCKEIGRVRAEMESVYSSREALERKLEIKQGEIDTLYDRIKALENTLENVSQEKENLVREKEELIHRWEEFYTSQTFKFVVRPLWKVLDFVKEMSGLGRPKLAVIKPYVVSKEELDRFIFSLRQREKNYKLYVFISCNSQQACDYEDIWAEKKFVFLADRRMNTVFKIPLFILTALINRFRRVYILESYYIPKGYRKARVIGTLLSTPEVYIYYLYQNREEKHPNLINWILGFIFSRISLYIIVSFFILFVTPWIKFKKLCREK